MEVGKLYACEEYHLMLYPDQETAAAGPAYTARAAAVAAHLSEQFGKPVSHAEKNIPLLVLNSKENFYEVLIEDKKGWIIYEDWLEIREIP